MSEQIIDTITRHAASAVSRRASLAALGGMALAAVTALPSTAKGGKRGKSRKKRNGGNGSSGNAGEQLAQAKCASQGDQCRASLAALCRGSECLSKLICCDFFATCNAPTGLKCIGA